MKLLLEAIEDETDNLIQQEDITGLAEADVKLKKKKIKDENPGKNYKLRKHTCWHGSNIWPCTVEDTDKEDK